MDSLYTGSYQDVTKQINVFTGPRGYAVLARHPKRQGKQRGDDKPFRKFFVECDRGGRVKPGFNEFERLRNRTTRNCGCTWKGVLYRTTEYTWVFHIHEWKAKGEIRIITLLQPL